MLIAELGLDRAEERRAGAVGELPDTGQIVVLLVGIDHISDPQPPLRCRLDVPIDIATGGSSTSASPLLLDATR
jgi:hypothetical protein